MKKPAAWLHGIPSHVLNGYQIFVRHLYCGEKPGIVFCQFRHHDNERTQRAIFPEQVKTLPYIQPPSVWRIFAMTYILSGTGVFTLKGRRFPMKPGSFFQLNGMRPPEYSLVSSDSLIECSFRIDDVTGDLLSERQVWDARIETGHIGRQPAVARQYFDLFNAIRNPAVEPGALLRNVTALVDNVYALHWNSSEDLRFIQNARQLLAQHCGPRDDLQALAARLHMSYSLFRKRFHRFAGVSPSAYQMSVRMERACELLQGRSVKEAAAELGYSDPFVFSRQFKQYLGVAPSQYQTHR